MKKYLIVLVGVLLIASCKKDELPAAVAPTNQNNGTPIDSTSSERLIQKGVLISNEVTMESDYKYQIWFDLGTNEIVSTNLRTDWDLAFDCDLNNNYLYLNSALNASVAMTSETDFEKVTSDAGLDYTNEHQSGREDKLAVGDVTNNRNVMVIDRGFDPAGKALGKWKIQITLVQDGDYYLTSSKLNGENLSSTVISKDPTYNRIAYSFKSQDHLPIEPPKTDYDLCFTQYTHIFENPPLSYSVNGVLINSSDTEVAEEFDLDFEDITEERAEALLYSTDLDVIGYDWKSFSLQSNTFTVDSDRNYVIRDASGNLFKMHFVDFYDLNGDKGTPSFKLVRL